MFKWTISYIKGSHPTDGHVLTDSTRLHCLFRGAHAWGLLSAVYNIKVSCLLSILPYRKLCLQPLPFVMSIRKVVLHPLKPACCSFISPIGITLKHLQL